MRGIRDKVALITGACSGIGAATALRFVNEGACVAVVCGRKTRHPTPPFLGLTHERTHIFEADVTRVEEIRSAVKGAVERFGRIDFLINNAGVEGVARLADIDEVLWSRVFDTNVKSTLFFTQSVVKHMTGGQGVIVNVVSQAGIQGEVLNSLYSASKFALVGFSQSMALELAPSGIRVNAVCPGPIETDLLERSIERYAALSDVDPKAYRERLKHKVPLGRFGSTTEVAGAIVFLCSEDASFITGCSMVIAGGMTLH